MSHFIVQNHPHTLLEISPLVRTPCGEPHHGGLDPVGVLLGLFRKRGLGRNAWLPAVRRHRHGGHGSRGSCRPSKKICEASPPRLSRSGSAERRRDLARDVVRFGVNPLNPDFAYVLSLWIPVVGTFALVEILVSPVPLKSFFRRLYEQTVASPGALRDGRANIR